MLRFFYLSAKIMHKIPYTVERMGCISCGAVYPFIKLVGELFGISVKVFGNAAYLCGELLFDTLHLCIEVVNSLLHKLKRFIAFQHKLFIV